MWSIVTELLVFLALAQPTAEGVSSRAEEAEPWPIGYHHRVYRNGGFLVFECIIVFVPERSLFELTDEERHGLGRASRLESLVPKV